MRTAELRVFTIFSIAPSPFRKYKQKQALQGKGMKIAMFLLTAIRQFCLVSYWLTASFPGFFITPSQ
jgi:hypothetical protein